ncbi:hypothetical protein QTO34_015880 [Cnephaeus nilssonii]|uniref:histone acetyltransferase n=1 Tax=Cnephaeus nilssonii TaxID=3371016 RepID=A0AA40I5V4_CNENI|nr:hypothetical protein QTO34_015880 [Eptesicus nilssonii]
MTLSEMGACPLGQQEAQGAGLRVAGVADWASRTLSSRRHWRRELSICAMAAPEAFGRPGAPADSRPAPPRSKAKAGELAGCLLRHKAFRKASAAQEAFGRPGAPADSQPAGAPGRPQVQECCPDALPLGRAERTPGPAPQPHVGGSQKPRQKLRGAAASPSPTAPPPASRCCKEVPYLPPPATMSRHPASLVPLQEPWWQAREAASPAPTVCAAIFCKHPGPGPASPGLQLQLQVPGTAERVACPSPGPQAQAPRTVETVGVWGSRRHFARLLSGISTALGVGKLEWRRRCRSLGSWRGGGNNRCCGAGAEEKGPPQEPEQRWRGNGREGGWAASAPAGVAGEPQFRSLWEWRHQAIQHCIQSLRHARQCRDANCPQPSFQKMRWVVQHTKGCQCKTSGGCGVCKQPMALCCYHAKHCQENTCPIPYYPTSSRSSASRRYSTASSTRSSCASGCHHQYPNRASAESPFSSFRTTLAPHTASRHTLDTTAPDCPRLRL